MNPELVGVGVRWGLATLGGILVHKGIVDQETANKAVEHYAAPATVLAFGVVSSVAAAGLSVWHKWTSGLLNKR